MPGSTGSNNTGGSVGHGGSGVTVGGTAVHSYSYSYGAGKADGGGGSGWRRRNFVGSAGAAARAGYGFVVRTDLEPGIGGDRRALWTCFCSFKTRRKRWVLVAFSTTVWCVVIKFRLVLVAAQRRLDPMCDGCDRLFGLLVCRSVDWIGGLLVGVHLSIVMHVCVGVFLERAYLFFLGSLPGTTFPLSSLCPNLIGFAQCAFRLVLQWRSYKMGRLTLHDLHEQNLEAMQCVVDLGRQLGRPIFTSLWSSRADRPNVGTPGEITASCSVFPPRLLRLWSSR